MSLPTFFKMQGGSNLLNPADIRAARAIYVIYVLTALILPRFFVKCGGIKRQQIIALASLGFGIAAVDLGRAIAYARAVAFSPEILHRPALDFSTMVYVASAIGAVLAGQVIVWSYPVANVYTALIAGAVGLVADGIELQIIFLVIRLSNGSIFAQNTSLVTTPWLVFTLAIVGLLLFLEFKSLCIPQHCRFLIGLLIPVLGIAVFGKVAGVSAVFGAAFNPNWWDFCLSSMLHLHFQADLVELHHPLDRILCDVVGIQVHILPRLLPLKHRFCRCCLCHGSI